MFTTHELTRTHEHTRGTHGPANYVTPPEPHRLVHYQVRPYKVHEA